MHRRKHLRSGSLQRKRSQGDVGGLDPPMSSEGRGCISARKSLWDVPLQKKEDRWKPDLHKDQRARHPCF